jgi:hypothetical protein
MVSKHSPPPSPYKMGFRRGFFPLPLQLTVLCDVPCRCAEAKSDRAQGREGSRRTNQFVAVGSTGGESGWIEEVEKSHEDIQREEGESSLASDFARDQRTSL